MSASRDSTPREASGETPRSSGARISTSHETVSGRIVIVDQTLFIGSDPVVTRCFELMEVGEVVDLTTTVRVHEEIQVTRTRSVHCKLGGTTIRQEWPRSPWPLVPTRYRYRFARFPAAIAMSRGRSLYGGQVRGPDR